MSDLISRANAIEAVCNSQCELDVPHYPQCDQVKWCDEVKALLALPSTNRPTDSILCDENERLKQMLQVAAQDISRLDGSNPNDYLHDLGTRDYFEELADRPKGEWIKHKGEWVDFDFYPTKYECSQCHYYVDEGYDSIFCPNCGVKMKGSDPE